MTTQWIKFECRDAEQLKHIEGLMKRNHRITKEVHEKVLGGPLNLLDGDVIEDALQSNLGTMHQLIRILTEKAG